MKTEKARVISRLLALSLPEVEQESGERAAEDVAEASNPFTRTLMRHLCTNATWKR